MFDKKISSKKAVVEIQIDHMLACDSTELSSEC